MNSSTIKLDLGSYSSLNEKVKKIERKHSDSARTPPFLGSELPGLG
jgi:hypothetical protein